ncbi:hypothetical protein [Tepidibacillus marianensis]|uniref:hypothetical protein n=1 Tax=Tepidibacillus marianensis TaxID=3131995 RepID=UPI0030D02DF2
MKYNKYLTLKLILGLTASMVLIIAESVNYYGMYGGLIFSIALNLAFGAYLILSWKHFIFPINNKVMEVWFSLSKFELFVLEGFSLTFIIMILFNISLFYSFLLFVFLGFLLLLIVYSGKETKTIYYLDVSIFFGMAIFLSIFSNLQKGIETNYHNLLYYHPKVLFINQEGSIRFLFIVFLILLSKMIMINNHDQLDIKKFGIFTFASSTAYIAFSLYAIVSTTEQTKSIYINDQLFLFTQKILPESGFILVAIMFIILIVDSIRISSFYTKRLSISKRISGHLIYSIGFFLFLYKGITILKIYLLFGLLHIAMAIIAMLIGIFYKRNQSNLS